MGECEQGGDHGACLSCLCASLVVCFPKPWILHMPFLIDISMSLSLGFT